jgi:hypothetical protein
MRYCSLICDLHGKEMNVSQRLVSTEVTAVGVW